MKQNVNENRQLLQFSESLEAITTAKNKNGSKPKYEKKSREKKVMQTQEWGPNQ